MCMYIDGMLTRSALASRAVFLAFATMPVLVVRFWWLPHSKWEIPLIHHPTDSRYSQAKIILRDFNGRLETKPDDVRRYNVPS